jgi:hypothetical protein
MFVVLVVVSGGIVAYGALTSGGRNISSTGVEESGPISTFPAAWDNPCGFQVSGNITTTDWNMSSSDFGLGNFSLNEVYARMVDSAAFRNISRGLGWVTISWGGFGETDGIFAAAWFAFISAGHPVGYAQVNFNLETRVVTIGPYETALISYGCPWTSNSSSSQSTST